MTKRVFFNWLKLFILIYCSVGIAVYYLQEKILFQSQKMGRYEPFSFNYPHTETNIAYDSATNFNLVKFTPAKPVKGVVLYFHGNRININHYARFAPFFTAKGYEVWMCDYPGYGKSTGQLSEQILYEEAMQVYQLAKQQFAKDAITIYGKSMGTGIAAYLASNRDCKQLILETPYYSASSLLSKYLFMYPLGRMLHYKIPTYTYLPKVTAPVTIFHGTADWLISYNKTKQLQPLLKKQDSFITIDGGEHNNLWEYPLVMQKLDSLMR